MSGRFNHRSRGGGRRGGGGGGKGNRRGNTGPKLPSSLLDEVASRSGSTASGYGSGSLNTLTRKKRRQLERKEAKQVRGIRGERENASSSGGSNTSSFSRNSLAVNRGYYSGGKVDEDDEHGNNNYDDDDDDDDFTGGKKSTQNTDRSKGVGASFKRKRGDDEEEEEDDEESDDDEDDLSDIEDDTLGTSGTVPASMQSALDSLSRDPLADDDEETIKRLEKKLGLTKGGSKAEKRAARKLNKEFAEEGLDDDFGSYLLDLDRVMESKSEKGEKNGSRREIEEEEDEDVEDDEDEDEKEGEEEDEEEEEEEEGSEDDDEDEEDYEPNTDEYGAMNDDFDLDEDTFDDDLQQQQSEESEDQELGITTHSDKSRSQFDRARNVQRHRSRVLRTLNKTGEAFIAEPSSSVNDGNEQNKSKKEMMKKANNNKKQKIEEVEEEEDKGITKGKKTKSLLKKNVGVVNAKGKRRLSWGKGVIDNAKPTILDDDYDHDDEDDDNDYFDFEEDGDDNDEEDGDDEKMDEEGDEDDDDEDNYEEDGEEDDDEELVDKRQLNKQVVPTAKSGAYVPPHLRTKESSSSFSLDNTTLTKNVEAGKGKGGGSKVGKPTTDRDAAFMRGIPDLSSSDRGKSLLRRVNGIINKVSDSNLEPLSAELAALYQTNSASECNTAVSTAILSACEHPTTVLRPIVTCFAALISSLHVLVGVEVGAFFLERALLKFAQCAGLPLHPDPTLSSLTGDKSLTSISSSYPEKTSNNILLLISLLFMFKTASGYMVTELMALLLARYTEKDVELLLLLFTHIGFQLRSDHPQVLQKIVKSILDKLPAKDSSKVAGKSDPIEATERNAVDLELADSNSTPLSVRAELLSQMILDVKNNRERTVHSQLLERANSLRKWLVRLAAKKYGVEGSDRSLKFGWSDVMKIPESGRWWLVGSSWAGKTTTSSSSVSSEDDVSSHQVVGVISSILGDKEGTSTSSSSSSLGNSSNNSSLGSLRGKSTSSLLSDFSLADAQLLPLAAKMRMNTPARQAIFIAIMGADDSDAAIERILRLDLRGPAEREIIRVLLDCCAQEASYNDFYDTVCSNLCTLRPSFKFTVQLALWDLFKLFGDEQHASQRRVYNLAMLLANLILRNTATLTILKPLEAGGGDPGGGAESGDMSLASETGSFFTKALLSAILSKAKSASEVERVFERCGGSGADRSVIRDSLSIFLQKHIKAKKLVLYSNLTLSDAIKRIKSANNALDSVRDISLAVENNLASGNRKRART